MKYTRRPPARPDFSVVIHVPRAACGDLLDDPVVAEGCEFPL